MSTYVTKRAKELGIKTMDARRPLNLDVLSHDVLLGKLKDPEKCAFSRACLRQHEVRKAYFFRSTAWLEYKDRFVRYLLPQSMQKEIVAFDRGQAMEPGSYRLMPPVKSQRMSEVRKRSAQRPGRHQPGKGKIKRRVVHRTTGIRGLQVPA